MAGRSRALLLIFEIIYIIAPTGYKNTVTRIEIGIFQHNQCHITDDIRFSIIDAVRQLTGIWDSQRYCILSLF